LAVFRPAWATSYTDKSEIWLWIVYPFILAHQFRDLGVAGQAILLVLQQLRRVAAYSV